MADEQKQPEYDEKYLSEWVAYGQKRLDAYMTSVAKFEAWCLRHQRKDEDETAPSEG